MSVNTYVCELKGGVGEVTITNYTGTFRLVSIIVPLFNNCRHRIICSFPTVAIVHWIHF